MEEGKKEKEHKIHVGQGNDMTGESKKVPTDMPQSNNSVLLVVIVASAAITAGVWFQTHKLGVEITNLVQILQNVESSSKHQQTQQQSRPAGEVLPRDCFDIQMMGEEGSGVYKIYPEGIKGGVDVFCDMENDSGGWLVFQRRLNGNADFYQNWENYTVGFGDIKNEFWLGNILLNIITNQGWYQLRVDMSDFEGESKYAKYKIFRVGDISSNYPLTVVGYSGDAGNSMQVANGMKFSTHDVDNDGAPGSCAKSFKGGFWYNNCHYANPNGEYLKGEHEALAVGVNWYHWKGYKYSLKSIEMKIKPL
ncbi:ficolin [Mytilus galloprovincialis]|uniref:Ficolin n=1 Tax=Mytilus galloprovincialis TaxID=29158 RepID=A0A8B6DMA0_MYTGA|nr:ficolin [Mytilus galloprovincialis]